MSENNNNIGYVNVTSTEIKCPGCGTSIGIHFNPATGTLNCPFCGLSTQLPTPKNGAFEGELDFNSALQRASVDWGCYKKLIICSNCGGQAIYDAEQISGACPFCGSTSVTPAAENDRIMAPTAIIPFAFSKEQAQDYFIKFVKKKTLLNKKALNCKLENIVGIYLPFWTFDTFTASTYNARRYNGQEAHSDHVTGDWYEIIDDVLVCASNGVNNPYISKILDYDFGQVVPYSAKYLAGIPAERYTIGLNDCWEHSKKLITKKLKKDIHLYNRELGVEDIVTSYYNVKYRYVLAPIYLAQYKFGHETKPVAINGQTGKTVCDVPTILGRLIVLGAIGMFLAFIIELFFYILYYGR